MKGHFFSFTAAVLVASTALSGCLGDDGGAGNKGTLNFGTEAAYPPFEDQTANGDIFGFDVDVIREIGNRSGYTINLQHMQFTAIIPSVQSGQIDGGISAFTITDERKQQVDFTISYYDNELMVAVRSGETGITKPEDLTGKRVCTQTGTTSEEWLRTNAGATNESMVLLDNFPPCKDSLLRGDVQAMMIDRAVVRELIEGSGGELKEAFTIPVDEHFGIAISKDKKDVLDAFNQALTDMKSDGTLDDLKDKWKV